MPTFVRIYIYEVISDVSRVNSKSPNRLGFRPDSATHPFGGRTIGFRPALLEGHLAQLPPCRFPPRTLLSRAPPPVASTPNWADRAEMESHWVDFRYIDDALFAAGDIGFVLLLLLLGIYVVYLVFHCVRQNRLKK